MNRDQGIGTLVVVASILISIVYLYALFLASEPVAILGLKLTGTAAVLGVFSILGWIGYTLATTPPPVPIEELGEFEKLGAEEEVSEEGEREKEVKEE